jgi:hypothetical protein
MHIVTIRTQQPALYIRISAVIRFSYEQTPRHVRVLERITTSSVSSVSISVPLPSRPRNQMMVNATAAVICYISKDQLLSMLALGPNQSSYTMSRL